MISILNYDKTNPVISACFWMQYFLHFETLFLVSKIVYHNLANFFLVFSPFPFGGFFLFPDQDKYLANRPWDFETKNVGHSSVMQVWLSCFYGTEANYLLHKM